MHAFVCMHIAIAQVNRNIIVLKHKPSAKSSFNLNSRKGYVYRWVLAVRKKKSVTYARYLSVFVWLPKDQALGLGCELELQCLREIKAIRLNLSSQTGYQVWDSSTREQSQNPVIWTVLSGEASPRGTEKQNKNRLWGPGHIDFMSPQRTPIYSVYLACSLVLFRYPFQIPISE